MSRSQELRVRDVRAVIRLLREICELGEDPRVWRIHMLERLQFLIGSAFQSSYAAPLPFNQNNVAMIHHVCLGCSEICQRYIAEGDVSENPMTPFIASRSHTRFTCTRQQMCPDGAWYGSDLFNGMYRRLGWDDVLVSIVGLPGRGCFSGMGFTRERGDRSFDGRERRLVHLLHMELGEFWRDKTPALEASLAPRLPRGARLLRRGFGEKEIAAELCLSKHTIHDYVKELYTRFDVSSRYELLHVTSVHKPFHPTLC